MNKRTSNQSGRRMIQLKLMLLALFVVRYSIQNSDTM